MTGAWHQRVRDFGWGFAGVVIAALMLLGLFANVPLPQSDRPFTTEQRARLAEVYAGGRLISPGTYQRCEAGQLVRYYSDQRRIPFLMGCWE